MRILVAPDKFKGSLTATEVTDAIVDGIQDAWQSAGKASSEATILTCPIGDGGEGTMELIARTKGLKEEKVTVTGPMGHPTVAHYFHGNGQAFLEMASASGLVLVPREIQNPELASTYGTGELIEAARKAGAMEIFVGLGGSATIDGGMGCLEALGFRFLDQQGKPLNCRALRSGTTVAHLLLSVHDVEPPNSRHSLPTLVSVADVTSPLHGPTGAIARFARQKGLPPHKLQEYARALESFSMICERSLGIKVADVPGTGAAGGLGFGLLLAGGSLVPGFSFFAQAVELDKLLHVDLAITGEGKLDAGSLEGKGPGSLARMLKQKGIPCIAICGKLEHGDKIRESHLFESVYEIGKDRSPEESMQKAAQYLRQAAKYAISQWLASNA